MSVGKTADTNQTSVTTKNEYLVQRVAAAISAHADSYNNDAAAIATTNQFSKSAQSLVQYGNEISQHSNNDDESVLQSLSMRLQNELRMAKSQHLACTEVLLPADLLHRIASKMVVMSEKEPCGIRGSTIYIEFEDDPNQTR